MTIDPLVAIQAGIGVLMIILATVLVVMGNRNRAAAPFALILTLAGAAGFGWALEQALGGGRGHPAMSLPLFQIPMGLAILYFASVFPRERAWVPRKGQGAWLVFLVGSVLFAFIFLFSPETYWGTSRTGAATGPLMNLELVLVSLVSLVPIVLIIEHGRMSEGPLRRQAALLATFFFVTLVNHTPGLSSLPALIAGELPGTTNLGYARPSPLFAWIWTLEQATFVGLAALQASTGEDRGARRQARVLGSAVVVLIVGWNVISVAAWWKVALAWHVAWDVVVLFLAVYAILKAQLFDIDLKVKWGLEKSTVAAIFIAVFFAVSEGAQVLLAGFAGNELLGVAAAALLVFFLAPLQRLANKVGDAALPGVEDTEAYREGRKEVVYRASIEELLVDGDVTPKERRMLGRLQDELGLDGGEASRIEADVVEAGTGGA